MSPKKFSKLSVGIKKSAGLSRIAEKGMREKKQSRFVERELFGLGKNFKQRTFFEPKKNRLLIRIYNGKQIVAKTDIKLQTFGGQTYATILWKQTANKYKKNGIMTQVLSEAEHVLTKAGVHSLSCHFIGGRSIYKKLGFDLRSRFGETYASKVLNP